MLCTHLLCTMGKKYEEYSKDSLDAEAKVRYEKKLQLIDLATCLYKLSSKAWIDDVTVVWTLAGMVTIRVYRNEAFFH